MKKVKIAVLSMILVLSMPYVAQAHSGRTDSSGGHRDNKNKSGLGSYHYHCGGYPAHLHNGGVCPYDSSVDEEEEEIDEPVETPTPKDSIAVKNYNTTMKVNEEVELGIDVTSYVDAENYEITSSDESIVRVEENKLVAVGAGKAKITVATSEASKSFEITVQKIKVDKIAFHTKEKRIQQGEGGTLDVIVSPENATDKKVIWSSSNSNVAEVAEDGTITAVGTGECVIKAVSNEDTKKVAECKISVFDVKPNGIEVNKESYRIQITDQDTLEFKVLPENSNNITTTCTVADENIIRIVDERIEPVNVGRTEITISTWNGVKKTIPVEVYCNPVENVVIDSSKLSYLYGAALDTETAFELECRVEPEDATYKEILLESSNEKLIKVSENRFQSANISDVLFMEKVKLTAKSKDGKDTTLEITLINQAHIVIVVVIAVAGIIMAVIGRRKFKKKHTEKKAIE